MAVLVSAVIMAVHLYYTKKRKGRLLTVGSVYISIWCVCLAISSFGLYELFVPSLKTYILAYGHCIIFSLISLFSGRLCNNLEAFVSEFQYDESHNLAGGKLQINTFLMVVLHIITYLYSANYFRTAWSYLSLFGVQSLRGASLEDIGQTTSSALMFQWVLLPVFSITMIYAGIKLVRERKFSIIVVFAILDAVLYGVLYGGRYIFFKLAFFLIMPAIIENSKGIFGLIKREKKIFAIVVAAFIVIVVITSDRRLSGFNFAGNVIVYYTGSIGFLDKLMDTFNPPQYYGYFTFGSVINFVRSVLNIVFSIPYAGSDQVFNDYTAAGLRIGAHTIYNSLSTSIYPFVLDFGYYFSFIGTVLFALLANFTEKQFYRKRSASTECLYIFVLYTVFDSILKYNFISPGSLISLILPFLFVTRRPINFVFNKRSKENAAGSTR